MKNIVVFAGNDCVKVRQEYYYSLAYKTGKLLAEEGFTVVSGGGPGLMNELMRGAFEAGGKTIAVCLEIPGRKHTVFATEKLVFYNLKERQNKLISYADAFLSLPGGVGTLYEIFAVLALKRKAEIDAKIPFILIGQYFQNLQVVLESMIAEGFMNGNLHNFYKLADTPQIAVSLLKDSKS